MSRGTCNRNAVDENLLNSRLDTIRTALIDKGIDGHRINTVVGGFGDAPECATGAYNESEGAKNRRVDLTIKN